MTDHPTELAADAGARVLVVDDDENLLRVLTVGFEARGYEVRVAPDGRRALDEAQIAEPDVVILDLGLPDLDGIEVCRHLRLRSRSPIIVLSADGNEERKIAALDLGADDYLTKPFSMPELLARVRVALRHRRALASVVDEGPIDVGALRVDTAAHLAEVDGTPLDLTPKEFALLALLARNAGKVLTHRTLLDQVWGSGQALDTLRTHVSLLRRKLGRAAGTPTIMTEPGVGYRLLQPEES